MCVTGYNIYYMDCLPPQVNIALKRLYCINGYIVRFYKEILIYLLN